MLEGSPVPHLYALGPADWLIVGAGEIGIDPAILGAAAAGPAPVRPPVPGGPPLDPVLARAPAAGRARRAVLAAADVDDADAGVGQARAGEPAPGGTAGRLRGLLGQGLAHQPPSLHYHQEAGRTDVAATTFGYCCRLQEYLIGDVVEPAHA
jgi:hypothetical protein